MNAYNSVLLEILVKGTFQAACRPSLASTRTLVPRSIEGECDAALSSAEAISCSNLIRRTDSSYRPFFILCFFCLFACNDLGSRLNVYLIQYYSILNLFKYTIYIMLVLLIYNIQHMWWDWQCDAQWLTTRTQSFCPACSEW